MINCNVILRHKKEDIGLVIYDEQTLYCELTVEGFTYMTQMIEGFCKKDTDGYPWLYDTWENPDLSEIEFLVSPGGTW